MRSPNRPLTVRALLVASLPLTGSLLSCSSQPQDPTPTPDPAKTASADTPAEMTAPAQGIVASTDAVRNVPRFMWGVRGDVSVSLAGAAPEVAARAHLAQHAATYGLSGQVVANAEVHDVHPLQGGASIVSFRQSVGGIEVYGVRQGVAMTADRQLVAISGSLHPGKIGWSKFDLSEGQAVAYALSHRMGAAFDESSFEARGSHSGYSDYNLVAASHAGGVRLIDNATVKKVYMPVGSVLEAAYFVEFIARADENSDNDGWRYIISARDGSVLERMSITQFDAFNYKVYADFTTKQPQDGPQTDYTPHPTGTPDQSKPNPLYASPVMVSMEGFNKNPMGTVDPWLLPTATETNGNNVDAYTDSNTSAQDGYTPAVGDVRATTTADKTFDRTYDPTKDPQYVDPTAAAPVFNDPQRMAAVTQLFYVTNWLHDYWYDSGFNEAAGNAQLSNYGRGGLENDPLKVEAQDDAPWGTRNNANMSTRAEGTSPRMQMYLWSGIETLRSITSPSLTFAGPFGMPTWGPQNFDVTGQAAIAISAPPPPPPDGGSDGGGDAASDVRVDVRADADSGSDTGRDGSGDGSDGGSSVNSFACTPLTAAVAGKIAIVDEGGGCAPNVKIANVKAAGATGMIVVSASSTLVSMAGRADRQVASIPSMAVNAADGALIKGALQADGSTLQLTMKRTIGPESDGTIDNTVSGHEWGHYFHLRLVQCGNTQCSAMSEGWGDFTAMHMLARPADNLDGSYAVASYAGQGIRAAPSDAWYFGIRRSPYSVDFKKNAMTFRHIQAGEPLPTTAPMNPSTSPNNEVHAAGEIWANMMHEVHIAMLKESAGAAPRMTWAEAHRRVANYIVAGMKMTPPSPTYTDQRDAILAAAAAVDKQDLLVMAKAFARRGAGTGAKSPPQNSTDLVGVVESYAVKGDIRYLSTSLDDSVKSCDRDGYLDGEEEGLLTIKLVNNGVSDLTKTTVTVQTSVPGVTFENMGVVSLPTLEPFKETTVRLKVSLDNTFTQLVLLPITITVNDPDAFTANTPIDFPVYVNRENVPLSSATDDVESDTPVWDKVHNPLPQADGGVAAPDAGPPPPATFSWGRERATGPGANNVWHGQDIAVRGDETLVSPTLNVASTGNLVMTFRHAFSFEANTTAATPQYYDGGVIEYSEDGTNWIDIGTIKDPGYNAALTVAAGTVDNPLQGRRAFAAVSANFPTMANVTVDLGTALAGKNIKVRFRLGTDTGTGAPGWFVDNIGFTGITNKPFPAQTADNQMCAGLPIANAGPDQSVALNAMVTLDGSGSSDPVAGPGPLAYAWDQLAGPAVTLASPTTARPTFTAPMTPTTLTFRLVVDDTQHGASDTVNIIVGGGGGGTDGGTDGGRDGGGGTGGAGGTDAGRDGAAGGDASRDAASDAATDGTASDAPRSDAPSDARDVRTDGVGGAVGGGGGGDDGCSCRIAQPKGRRGSTGTWAMSLLGAMALLAGRRRRRH